MQTQLNLKESPYYQILKDVGHAQDKEIDPLQSALCCAYLYENSDEEKKLKAFIALLVEETKERYERLLEGRAEKNGATQLAALKHVVCDTHGFHGTYQDFDNLKNTDLVHVLQRKEGLPISFALIFLHIARKLNWDVKALNFPGHIFMRLDCDGERILFDPFEDCKIVEAHHLRQKLIDLGVPSPDLSASYYEPLSNRECLLRLQNNRKTRQVAIEDYEGALLTIALTQAIAPQETRLLFEQGLMLARVGQRRDAISVMRAYLSLAENDDYHQEALLILHELESELN